MDAAHPRVMTPVDAARLDHVPTSLLVLGGTPMALELASIYATLGTAVTVVDPLPALLRDVDGELVTLLLDVLRRRRHAARHDDLSPRSRMPTRTSP